MPSDTPQGHFEYPDLNEPRWYQNGERIEIDGTTEEQTHDGIVDWLEQLEIRLTGVVNTFDELPDPDASRRDHQTGNERIYLVRNRETFYRDDGDEWVVTGGDEGDAVGAGDGLVLAGEYAVDLAANFAWTGRHTFNGDTVAFTIGNQGGNPVEPGDVTRDDSDVLVHSGGTVQNLSNIGTGGNGGGGGASDVISSPNLNIPYSELADGDRLGFPVAVPPSDTIEVQSWGVTDTDGETPTGLAVELRDPSDNLVSSENTAWNSNPNGIASWTNDTGQHASVTLAIYNGSGSGYADPAGVGGQVGYVMD